MKFVAIASQVDAFLFIQQIISNIAKFKQDCTSSPINWLTEIHLTYEFMLNPLLQYRSIDS